MNLVYKYLLPINGEAILEAHELFRPLHVAEQSKGKLCLWALVDTSSLHAQQRILVYGTGQPIEDPAAFEHYIGTVCMSNGLVWHICHAGRFES